MTILRTLVLGSVSVFGLFFFWGDYDSGPTNEDRTTVIIHAAQALTTALDPYVTSFGGMSNLPPHGSPVRGRVSSGFGMRFHPRYKRMQPHRGVDIAAAIGSPVMSTAGGWVVRVDRHPRGYGLFVELIHPGSGYRTLYAHLSHVYVQTGQMVRRGDVVALTGASGNALGPHLHYEVRRWNGEHVDPMTIDVSE